MKAIVWLIIGIAVGVMMSGYQAAAAGGAGTMQKIWVGLEIPEWAATWLPPALVIRQSEQCKPVTAS
jgi:hypothetical protein